MPRPKVQFCPKGHDKTIVGLTLSNGCKACQKMRYASPEARAANISRPQYRVNYSNQNWKRHGILNEKGAQFAFVDYDRLYQIQGGRCAFPGCGKHQTETKESMHVDHDHITGKVRSLLCSVCNRITVGHHTIQTAEKLVEYLRNHAS